MTVAHDDIRLTVPARAEYARIARITTSGVASRLGFSIDELEQLKVAVGEVWSMVTGGDDDDQRLTIVYAIRRDHLAVDVRPSRPRADLGASHIEITEKLLEETVDEHDVAPDGTHVRMVKRVG